MTTIARTLFGVAVSRLGIDRFSLIATFCGIGLAALCNGRPGDALDFS